MEMIERNIDGILTYCRLNGKADDRWCIGNMYNSVDAANKHNIMSSNLMFVFSAETAELAQEIIHRVVDEHGFIKEGDVTMRRFFYVFRVQEHNLV